jgi:hypothetical protein
MYSYYFFLTEKITTFSCFNMCNIAHIRQIQVKTNILLSFYIQLLKYYMQIFYIKLGETHINYFYSIKKKVLNERLKSE